MALVAKSTQYTSRFSPTSIPGCALWLDAADSSSITLTGSNMAGWRDKSGTGRTVTFSNTCTYTSNTPSVNTSIAAGSRIVVDVDLRKSFVKDANIFIVYAWSGYSLAGSSNQFLWGQDIGGGWNRVQFLAYPAASSFSYGLGYQVAPPYFVAVSNMATSNRLLYHATYSYQTANGTFVNINGTLASSPVTEGAAGPETTSTSTVFGTLNTDPSAPLANLEFNEIIVFNTPITVAQRQTIEGYLAAKWGLASSLPASHPFKSAQTFTRPFQPVDILGCRLWLDAADSDALVISGTDVTTWRDKSGNGFNFTVPGNFVKPVYTSNAINGLPAISFTGTGGENRQDMMLRNTSFSLNVSAYSMFVVARQNASSPSPYGANYILGAVSGSPLLYGTYTGGNFITSVGSTGSFNDLTVNSPNTQMKSTSVTGMVVNGSVLTPYFNGTAMSTKNGATGSYTGLDIGASGGGQTWQGVICEILVFNSALTTAERQIVENYLATKWGLRGSMPAGHPTRLTPALSPQFNPLLVGGCALWLDGTDPAGTGSPPAVGSTVSTWVNKSSATNNLTLTAGTTTSILDGTRRVVNFPLGALMTSASTFVITTSSAIFIVTKVTTVESPASMMLAFSNIAPAGEAGDYSIRFTSSGLNGTAASGGNSNDIGNNNYYVNGNFNPNFPLSTYTSDYTIIDTVTPGTGGTTAMTLSSLFASTRRFNGRIAEVLIYPGGVTIAQRQVVEGYLASKWGLANNLPAGHPYKTFKP